VGCKLLCANSSRCVASRFTEKGTPLTHIFSHLAPRTRAHPHRQLLTIWSWITSALFVCSIPLRAADPVNAVKADPSERTGPRKFASITIPLDDLRHISKLLNVTINTVAVSCLAGGLRRYLLQTGGGGAANGTFWQRLCWRITEQQLTKQRAGGAEGVDATIPPQLMLCSIVDTRAMRRGKSGSDGCNTVSFIGVPVATGPAFPLVRLVSVSKSLEWVRGSLGIFLAVAIPPIIQFFVRDAASASSVLAVMLPGKTTLGFSNMRGPVKRVRLCGYPVEKMYNGVQPSLFGCFISLMSYENQVGWLVSRGWSPGLVINTEEP